MPEEPHLPGDPKRMKFEFDPKPVEQGGVLCMACECGHPLCISMKVGLYGGNLMDVPESEGSSEMRTAVVVSISAVKAIHIARGLLELAQIQLSKMAKEALKP